MNTKTIKQTPTSPQYYSIFFAKNSRNVNISAPLNLIFFASSIEKSNSSVLQYFFSFRFSQVSQYHSTLWAWASFQSPREALSSEVISSGNVSSSPGRTKQICIHFTKKTQVKIPVSFIKVFSPSWVAVMSCSSLSFLSPMRSMASSMESLLISLITFTVLKWDKCIQIL